MQLRWVKRRLRSINSSYKLAKKSLVAQFVFTDDEKGDKLRIVYI